MSYDETTDPDGEPRDQRWQWVIIAVLIALLLLLLGYCTVRSNNGDNTANPGPSVTDQVVPISTTATSPAVTPVIEQTTPAAKVTATATAVPTTRRTPAAAPQTDGGSTGPGNGVPRVAGGLALLVAAVLGGAFATTRWRAARQ